MTNNALPSGFEDLAEFMPDWACATEIERNRFRVAQSLAELKRFYDAMMPRLDAISSFLNDFPLHAMPRDCANLLELALMTMEVAPAVEYYNSPDVPESVEYEKFDILPVRQKYTVLDDNPKPND
ncbi:MAG: hypothetical protein ACI9BW_004739 [Gammaproteobacteria bacterium]|jgi:hypothetical protein